MYIILLDQTIKNY